jgi:hypothetical protein
MMVRKRNAPSGPVMTRPRYRKPTLSYSPFSSACQRSTDIPVAHVCEHEGPKCDRSHAARFGRGLSASGADSACGRFEAGLCTVKKMCRAKAGLGRGAQTIARAPPVSYLPQQLPIQTGRTGVP